MNNKAYDTIQLMDIENLQIDVRVSSDQLLKDYHQIFVTIQDKSGWIHEHFFTYAGRIDERKQELPLIWLSRNDDNIEEGEFIVYVDTHDNLSIDVDLSNTVLGP